MNTLFKSKVSRKSVLATAQEKIPKTIEIKSISHGMASTAGLCANLMCFSLLFFVSSSLIRDLFQDISGKPPQITKFHEKNS